MLLSSAGRVKALDRRVDLSHAKVNSVPQGWFGQLPSGLSVKVCVCHQDGLSRLAQSGRRVAGRVKQGQPRGLPKRGARKRQQGWHMAGMMAVYMHPVLRQVQWNAVALQNPASLCVRQRRGPCIHPSSHSSSLYPALSSAHPLLGDKQLDLPSMESPPQQAVRK